MGLIFFLDIVQARAQFTPKQGFDHCVGYWEKRSPRSDGDFAAHLANCAFVFHSKIADKICKEAHFEKDRKQCRRLVAQRYQSVHSSNNAKRPEFLFSPYHKKLLTKETHRLPSECREIISSHQGKMIKGKLSFPGQALQTCIDRAAKRDKNARYCQYYWGNGHRRHCLNLALQSQGLCTGRHGARWDTCWINIAREKVHTSYCNFVDIATDQQHCFESLGECRHATEFEL